ncbi:MAG: peptidylprolyl isomerase [Bdellovibrionales bacterium]
MLKVLLFGLSLLGADSGNAKVVDKIVAIVNDQPITLSDVDRYRKRLQSGGLVDEALLQLSDSDSLLKNRDTLLTHLIDEKLIDSEVKRKNLEVTIERVEQEIRNIAKENGITRQQLQDALKVKNVSLSQYQDFVRTSLERKSLIDQEVRGKVRISDEDISSHFLAKKGPSGAQIFEYTLSHIVFSPKNGGDDAARKRAQEVREKLRQGQSFEKLAEEYSEDPNFSKGGLLGTFKAGEMLKEIEQAVRKVPPGEITPVVKTSVGYQIIKVNKRTLISDPQLDEERETIRQQLYADTFRRQFRLWLKQRRDDSFIKINGF